MKKVFNLFISIFILGFIFNASAVHAQCADENTGRKNGIAIVRSEEGKPENPKGAMTFPRYVGGTKALCKFICQNMQYPEKLKEQNVSGTTTISFMVNSDGSVSDVEIVKSSGYQEFDDEATRLANSFPNWKAATKDCEATSMKTQTDIEFNCEKCGCGNKK